MMGLDRHRLASDGRLVEHPMATLAKPPRAHPAGRAPQLLALATQWEYDRARQRA